MRLPLRISEEADAELNEAVRWYEEQRPGLGGEFLTALDDAFSRIENNPALGSEVPRVDDHDIHRIFVRRFPYHVAYLKLPDRLQILAVAHDRRRPAYWVDRLPS